MSNTLSFSLVALTLFPSSYSSHEIYNWPLSLLWLSSSSIIFCTLTFKSFFFVNSTRQFLLFFIYFLIPMWRASEDHYTKEQHFLTPIDVVSLLVDDWSSIEWRNSQDENLIFSMFAFAPHKLFSCRRSHARSAFANFLVVLRQNFFLQNFFSLICVLLSNITIYSCDIKEKMPMNEKNK